MKNESGRKAARRYSYLRRSQSNLSGGKNYELRMIVASAVPLTAFRAARRANGAEIGEKKVKWWLRSRSAGQRKRKRWKHNAMKIERRIYFEFGSRICSQPQITIPDELKSWCNFCANRIVCLPIAEVSLCFRCAPRVSRDLAN